MKLEEIVVKDEVILILGISDLKTYTQKRFIIIGDPGVLLVVVN